LIVPVPSHLPESQAPSSSEPSPSASAPPTFRTLEALTHYWARERDATDRPDHLEVRRAFRHKILRDARHLERLLGGLDGEACVWLTKALNLARRIGARHEESRWCLGVRDRLRKGHASTEGTRKGNQIIKALAQPFHDEVLAIARAHPAMSQRQIAIRMLRNADKVATDKSIDAMRKRVSLVLKNK
jgi:hypothetical protein